MRLYKYTSSEICLKILKSGLIRFTQPLLFNDPFDSNPLVKNMYKNSDLSRLYDIAIAENQSEILELLVKSFDTTVSKFQPELITQLSSKDKINFFFDNMKKESSSLNKFVIKELDLDKFKKESIDQFLKNSSIKTGVFSLTKNPTDLLMWAHYANSHTGFVLEFDVADPFFNAVENKFYPTFIEIKYKPNRPVIDTDFFNSNSSELYKQFELIFFTKSIDWKYEQEVRIVKQLTDQNDSGLMDLDGFPIHLFPFPRKSLKSIIVGSRTKSEDLRNIEGIVNQKYKNITIKSVELDKIEYKLNLINT